MRERKSFIGFNLSIDQLREGDNMRTPFKLTVLYNRSELWNLLDEIDYIFENTVWNILNFFYWLIKGDCYV